MVSSFSNPGFPPVDVHPTRLPAMDARLSAALDSFEASLRAALRAAIREALDSAFANFTTNFSRDWALLRRDSALRAEGVSDPVPTTSDDTQSIDLGQTGLQGADNPPRLPSPVQVHSVPPLLSSSPLLRALATPVVKPQSIDSVAAIVSLLGSKTVIPDSVMTTASQLLPDCSASMFSNMCQFSGNEFTPPTFFRKSGAEFMQAQPSMIAHKCQQGLVGMYARYVFDEIPDSCCCVVLDRDMCYCKGIQDKGGGSKFRSPDECRRKLEEKIAKSDYDVSIGCFITKKLHVWCQLPRVLWIRRHEVLRSLIYNLSHGEAKWYWILLFILAYYTGVIVILYEDSLTEKCGWVNWYLVGKFVKKNLFALHLFDELPKRWRENNMAISEVMKGRFSNEYFPSDSSNNHSIAQTILLLRKLCRTNRGEQGRAAANTCCLLLLSQSDNNVKLIVLDRLTELKSSHRKGVADMFMDVLRAFSSHNLDIRRKTLAVVLSLVTCKNINVLVLILKREVVKTQIGELEKNGEYRQMLIQAIHSCAIKFLAVASTVVHLLMDFLGGSNVAFAVDMIVLIQEIIEANPRVKVSIITKLLDTFYQIRASWVCSSGLWIFGACCMSLPEVKGGTATIIRCLSELPFLSVSEDESNDSSQKVQQVNSMTVSFRRPTILVDGTYATHHDASGIAFSPSTLFQGKVASGNLRSLLLTGDFFLELQPISLTVFHSATVQIALSVSTALRALQPRYMLSGGQRSRDAFAKITTMKLHIILLGEPSNHRDLDVVEALIQGLVLVQGGILTVSNGKHLVSGSMDYKKIPLLQSSWEKSYQPFIHHSDFGNIAIELKTCPFTSVLLQVLMFHNWWSSAESLPTSSIDSAKFSHSFHEQQIHTSVARLLSEFHCKQFQISSSNPNLEDKVVLQGKGNVMNLEL